MSWGNSQTVGEVMLPVRRVSADQTARSVLTILLAEKLEAVAVMKDEDLLGMCTHDEIISAVAARPTHWGDQPIGDVIPKIQPPPSVRSSLVLWRAEDLLRQQRHAVLPVVDEQHLVGMISAKDIRQRFLAMLSDRLSERSRELRNLLERIQDLDDQMIQMETLGTRLQQRLNEFPCPLIEPRLSWSALSRPGELCATSFQDIVHGSGDTVFFIQIDGAGHTLGAVLVDLALRAQLADWLRVTQQPGEVLANLNRFLAGVAKDQLITAWAARIHFEDQTLRYATAGHPPPWFLPSTHASWKNLEGRGSFLGQAGDVKFAEYTVPWTAGAKLFLHNRAVLSPTTPYSPHITATDLMRFLSENAQQNAATLVTRFADYLSEHRGASLPSDTILLMAMAFLPSP